jgi:dolichyl-phosphate beta-glucosyltransferase
VRHRLRSILSRCFAQAASRLLGVRVYDSQCGAKLFRAVPDVRTLFAERFRTNWVFDVELLARLARTEGKRDPAKLRRRVREIPLDAWHEKSGSKIKLRGFARAAWELLVLFWSYRVRKHAGDTPLPAAGASWLEAPRPEPAATAGADHAQLVGTGKPR